MLWECCSGTIRIWGRPSPAAMASSKARVFPVPARPSSSLSMSLPPFFGQILNYIISRPAAQSWTAGTSPLSTSLRYATINNIAIWRCGKLDAQIFWKVIGAYNMDTWGLQIVLLLVLLVMFALSYTQKAPWAAKFALGIANLWIGLAFFARYGSEPIQKYFVLPLYLLFGILFHCMSRHSADGYAPNPPPCGACFCCSVALPPRLPPSGKRLSANGDTYYALSHCQSEHHGLCGLPAQEQASPCSSDSLGADGD